MLIIFLALSFFTFADEIEIFCDWAHNATGYEGFPLNEDMPLEELPLQSYLRRKLNEKGCDIRCWEMEKYFPSLMSWKSVHCFNDLQKFFSLDWKKKDLVPNDTKYWMFWNLGPKLVECDFSKIPKEKLILVMWEPPTTQKELYDPEIHKHFGKIFTWNDDLVDNQKYFKFTYPTLKPRVANIPSFKEKKFCVMICRRLTSKHPNELYSKRKEMIKFFEEMPEGEFDLYGFYWKPGKFKNYRGPLHSDKIEKLKEYKFSICYENMGNVKGYITEKIFDCFAAGVVPVYWGASDITDYIPKNCFIDRRAFANENEVYAFLKSMSEEEHQKYLDAAANYLESEKAKVFSTKHFVENLVKQVLD